MVTATDYYPFGMPMPGRNGIAFQSDWVPGRGFVAGSTYPDYLQVASRPYAPSPGLYKAGKEVELLPGFETATATDELLVEIQAGSGVLSNDYPGGQGSNDMYGAYRYGFNGKENDNDVKGVGNQQDYGERIYDTRLARFLSTDPLTKSYPMLTPYQYASNSPIWMIDLDGLEGVKFSSVWNGRATLPQFIQNPDIYGTAVESAASLNRTINPIFSLWNYGVKLWTGTHDYDGNPIDSRGRSGVVADAGVETIMWLTGGRLFKSIPKASTPLEQQMAQNARATGTPPAKPAQSQAVAKEAQSPGSTTSKPLMQPQQVQQAQAKAVGITPNSTNYREVFFNANPSLRGKVWVHHAVEQNNVQKFYPGLFTQTELNSLGNLRGIPNSVNSELHLSKIRLEWNDFYRTHPSSTTTKQQILNKAAEIDLKFGSQFTPPK